VVASAPLALVRADRNARLRNLLVLTVLVGWLVYTRFFWGLKAVHATFPPCPFLLLTGHPCPLCGGTRSFAYLWQGDVADAMRLYPLGPVLFGGTLFGIGGLAAALLSDRTFRWRPSPLWERRIQLGAGAVLGTSWLLKLTVLPN
jgi:hypothetical protein